MKEHVQHVQHVKTSWKRTITLVTNVECGYILGMVKQLMSQMKNTRLFDVSNVLKKFDEETIEFFKISQTILMFLKIQKQIISSSNTKMNFVKITIQCKHMLDSFKLFSLSPFKISYFLYKHKI